MYRPEPHPAKAVLALRRITVREVARRAEVSEHFASRCLNGWQKPSPRFRAAVSIITGLPESALFRLDTP